MKINVPFRNGKWGSAQWIRISFGLILKICVTLAVGRRFACARQVPGARSAPPEIELNWMKIGNLYAFGSEERDFQRNLCTSHYTCRLTEKDKIGPHRALQTRHDFDAIFNSSCERISVDGRQQQQIRRQHSIMQTNRRKKTKTKMVPCRDDKLTLELRQQKHIVHEINPWTKYTHCTHRWE